MVYVSICPRVNVSISIAVHAVVHQGGKVVLADDVDLHRQNNGTLENKQCNEDGTARQDTIGSSRVKLSSPTPDNCGPYASCIPITGQDTYPACVKAIGILSTRLI